MVLGFLAGVLGFEPRDAGIKTRCLTAWLHPKNESNYYTHFSCFRNAVIVHKLCTQQKPLPRLNGLLHYPIDASHRWERCLRAPRFAIIRLCRVRRCIKAIYRGAIKINFRSAV